jgi:hypothetical protein
MLIIIHSDLAKLLFKFGVWEFLAIFLVTILCIGQNQNFQVRTKTFAKKKRILPFVFTLAPRQVPLRFTKPILRTQSSQAQVQQACTV